MYWRRKIFFSLICDGQEVLRYYKLELHVRLKQWWVSCGPQLEALEPKSYIYLDFGKLVKLKVTRIGCWQFSFAIYPWMCWHLPPDYFWYWGRLKWEDSQARSVDIGSSISCDSVDSLWTIPWCIGTHRICRSHGIFKKYVSCLRSNLKCSTQGSSLL